MSAMMMIVHWLAGFIVLAEALNKLERVTPFACGLSARQRVVDGLKALAWLLLAMGSAGAIATPFLAPLGVAAPASQWLLHQSPSLAEVFVLLGFAVLIVRTRIKEG